MKSFSDERRQSVTKSLNKKNFLIYSIHRLLVRNERNTDRFSSTRSYRDRKIARKKNIRLDGYSISSNNTRNEKNQKIDFSKKELHTFIIQ